MAAFNPFTISDPTRPVVGYENGIGNPNDYEYFVDPMTRTVKRRAKQTLAQVAGIEAPASGGSGGAFENPFAPGNSAWGATGKGTGSAPGQGPSLASQQAALSAYNVGSKMSNVPGLIGLLGYGVKGVSGAALDNMIDQIGSNYGLLDAPSGINLGDGTFSATISDPNGNLYSGTMSNNDSIQAQNVANFGIGGFDTSLGGYTGMSDTNSNAGTSGSPLGGESWGGGGYDSGSLGGGYSDGSDGGYW